MANKGSIYISVTASTRQCALVTKLTLLCSHREQNKALSVQKVKRQQRLTVSMET